MNCPGTPPLLSHTVRTASQITGASCHSSIKRGVSPIKRSDGLEAAVARYSSLMSTSCKLMELLAIWLHVVVFPHHFGPSTSTAPEASRLSCNIRSAILLRYSILNFHLFAKVMKINVKAQSNRCFRGISIGVFVAFQSVFSLVYSLPSIVFIFGDNSLYLNGLAHNDTTDSAALLQCP